MRIVLFLLLIGMVYACTEKSTIHRQPLFEIHLQPSQASAVQLSELISEFIFLKLDAPQGAYIGNPDKVRVSDERIYILDRYRTRNLMVFDKEGNFMYEISQQGRGPGELISPNDFIVDKKHDRIAIYDQGNLKVAFYHINTGEFITEHNLDFWSSNFARTETGFVFFNNNLHDGRNTKNVTFVDDNFNITGREIEIPSNQYGLHVALPRNFTFYNEQTYLTIPFNNTVFSIKDNVIAPYIQIDFGNYNLPENFFSRYSGNEERRREREQFAHNITNYFESDRYHFFNYRYNSGDYYYFHSKITNKTYHANKGLLHDDINLGPLYGWPVEIYQDYLIWYQQLFRLKDYFEELKYELSEEEWVDFLADNHELASFNETVDINDNAYLIFLKLDF